jgi:hypothetical protein
MVTYPDLIESLRGAAGHIRHLVLDGVRFASPDEFVAKISLFPSLESLHIDISQFDTKSFNLGTYDRLPCIPFLEIAGADSGLPVILPIADVKFAYLGSTDGDFSLARMLPRFMQSFVDVNPELETIFLNLLWVPGRWMSISLPLSSSFLNIRLIYIFHRFDHYL